LYFNRFFMLPEYSSRKQKTGKQSSYQEIGFCAKYLSLKVLSSP
jgi:hypothetical protein